MNDEIKTLSFPTFSALNVEVVKEYDTQVECLKHGMYNAHVTLYSDGEESKTRCPKCIKEEAEAEIAERKKARKIENDKYCRSLNIQPEYYDKMIWDYEPKTFSQEKAKEAVQELINNRTGKLILLGANGVGKSLLASIATKSLGGRIYTMYEISTIIRQAYTQKATKSEMEIVKELANLPFLAIDEVGRISNTEAVQNWFSFILDQRHTNKLPTMLTGNLHFRKNCPDNGCPKCFENYFDDDILSRLREDTTIVLMKGPDKRAGQNFKFFADPEEKKS